MAVTQAGDAIAQLLNVGHLRSPACRFYPDRGFEEARAMAQILIEAPGEESPVATRAVI